MLVVCPFRPSGISGARFAPLGEKKEFDQTPSCQAMSTQEGTATQGALVVPQGLPTGRRLVDAMRHKISKKSRLFNTKKGNSPTLSNATQPFLLPSDESPRPKQGSRHETPLQKSRIPFGDTFQNKKRQVRANHKKECATRLYDQRMIYLCRRQPTHNKKQCRRRNKSSDRRESSKRTAPHSRPNDDRDDNVHRVGTTNHRHLH